MQRIEFSEFTNRLHRNLMATAALIFAISFFQIKVVRFTASGFELENLTTNVLILILVGVMLYHVIAFSIRAFEEYRIWELQFTSKQATYYGGGTGVVELADQMHELAGTLQLVLQNTGVLRYQNQDVLTHENAAELKEAAKAAIVYGKRLKNFPRITRFRFWFWDLGVAGAITAIAILYAFAILPPARALFCD